MKILFGILCVWIKITEAGLLKRVEDNVWRADFKVSYTEDKTLGVSLFDDPEVNVRAVTNQGTVTNLPLINNYTMYLIELGIGTPPQKILAQFDTGSNDLWVYSVDNPMCYYNESGMDQIDCSLSGTFNSSASSTFTEAEPGAFGDTYGGGYSVSGDWVRDRVVVGGEETGLVVRNMTFGLGNFANASAAILGLGYPDKSLPEIGGAPYRSLPQQLAAEGTILTAAFSVWLNDAEAAQGSVLFGGVDHGKYNRSRGLMRVPILNGSNQNKSAGYVGFVVGLSQVNFPRIGGSGAVDLLNGTGVQAVLDSGATKSYLPEGVLAGYLYGSLNATDDEELGATVFECGLVEEGAWVSFNFSGATVEAPLSSFVERAEGDESKCVLGVYEYGLPFALLGDAVIRRAYLVYDMEHHEIGIGQAVVGGREEKEDVEMISGGIPGASEAPQYSQTSTLTGGYFDLVSSGGATGTAGETGGVRETGGSGRVAARKLWAAFASIFAVGMLM